MKWKDQLMKVLLNVQSQSVNLYMGTGSFKSQWLEEMLKIIRPIGSDVRVAYFLSAAVNREGSHTWQLPLTTTDIKRHDRSSLLLADS